MAGFTKKLTDAPEAITFDDVLLQPGYSEVAIGEIDVSTYVTRNLKIDVPIVSSPMDTVTEGKLAAAVAKCGGVGVVHYNIPIAKQVEHVAFVKSLKLPVGAAVGPNDDERVSALMAKEVDFLVIDTAHGFRKVVIDAVKRYKKAGADVVAGNIVSADAAEQMISAGADGLRVGLGPGSICFEAGALVLMDDYSVKPIESVQVGERVITHKGHARRVTKAYVKPYSGEMVKIKAGGSPGVISATSNHPFLAVTFDVDDKRMRKIGPKHYFHLDKYADSLDWKEAGSLAYGSVVVTPRKSSVQGTPSPVLDLAEWVDGTQRDDAHLWSEKHGVNPNVESHVDLARRFNTTPRVMTSIVHGGKSRDPILDLHANVWLDATHYQREFEPQKISRIVHLDESVMRLFGYYLAEGCVCGPEKNKSLRFCFSKLETAYHEDVEQIIGRKFNYFKSGISASKTRGGASVIAYSHVLARFFEKFLGNGCQDKKIPSFVFELDPRLLKGLLVGMIRGDGTVKETGRVTYTTTNATLAFQVAEIFSRLGFMASIRRNPKVKPHWSDTFKVGISGKQVHAFAKMFPELNVRLKNGISKQGSWQDEQFIYWSLDSVERIHKDTTVYNLEVEEDESYLVNRIAVHNCTTRIITGIGVPQLTAVSEVADIASQHKIPVIADGGIKYSGDLAKAIAAGASCGMLGNLFAGCDESPGDVIESEGQKFKKYRGMGSVESLKANYANRYDAFKKSLVPEGVSGLTKYRGSVDGVITQFEGGLRKAMVYVGAKNLEEFQRKARFVRITSSGFTESHPHSLMDMDDTLNYSKR